MPQEIFNMSAGQSALTPRCKSILGKLTVPVYYPPYWQIEQEVHGWLSTFLNTKNEIILLTGTGTYGLEASLNSILAAGEKFVVVNSGLFGQVLKTLVERVGGIPVEITVEPGKAVEPSQVTRVLEANPDVVGVGIVHSETSVGTRNPIEKIAHVVKEQGLLYLVDSISAFGAEELDVDRWGIDLCITSAQKCLGAPQGVAIVTVSTAAWETVDRRASEIHGICLNLHTWREYNKMVQVDQRNWKGKSRLLSPLTDIIHGPSPSFTIIQGLWASLAQIAEEGFEAFRQRHIVAAKAVRAGARAMGLQIMATDDAIADNAVTAILLPDRINETVLRRHLFDRYSVIFANGYIAELGINYLRFGTMGESARLPQVLYSMGALGMALRDHGVDVNVEAALAAVNQTYKEE